MSATGFDRSAFFALGALLAAPAFPSLAADPTGCIDSTTNGEFAPIYNFKSRGG
jgi:hypothetical protein